MGKDDPLKVLRERKKAWERTTLKESLRALPERKKAFTTTSFIPVQRLYTPLDLPTFDPEKDLGRPGEYPFTRGVHPTMYRGRLWTMRMFAGYGSAEDTNRRFRSLIEHGGTGVT